MKRWIAVMLAACLCGMLFSCTDAEDTEPSYTTKGTETTAPVFSGGETVNWEYKKIDLSNGKYQPTSRDADKSAAAFGYQKGTYEYDYFRALSGISFYAMISDHYLSNLTSDTEDAFVANYLERVPAEEFTAPYESILYHAYWLLSDRDFSLVPLSINLLSEYWMTESYELSPEERATVLALSFNEIDTAIIEYAKELISLREKYPEYEGEFTLSEKALEEAEALIEACRPIAEKRENLRESWRAYYQEQAPTLTVKEEWIEEYDAVKITLSGNGKYYAAVKGEYVENYQYELVDNSSLTGKHVQSLPMESPVVIYLPVSYYRGMTWNQQLDVIKVDENGRCFNETVTLTLNPEEYYSDEPIQMSNPFLDAVLRDYFGGDYSERDLLKIQALTVSYRIYGLMGIPIDPQISFHIYLGSNESVYQSYDYPDVGFTDSDGVLPSGTLEDLKHFHSLEDVALYQQEGGTELIPDDLYRELMPYEVTENTWYEETHISQ